MRMIPDFLSISIIVIIITLSSVPVFKSWSKLNFDVDFLQYASRHETIRKSLIEYHTFPTRSHWLGGGFPTLGDPEDPTLNPLVLITILFDPIIGLKLIVFFALLIGGLATYCFCTLHPRIYTVGITFFGIGFWLKFICSIASPRWKPQRGLCDLSSLVFTIDRVGLPWL